MQVAPSLFQQQQPSSSCPKPIVVVVETAYEWWQRSQRARIAQSVAAPQDPSAAAWAFCRPSITNSSSDAAVAIMNNTSSGTGIAFVDAALRSSAIQPQQPQSSLPVVDVRGATDTGKTWTVVSLAARFVVATRLSQFSFEKRRKQQQQQSSSMMLEDREVESMQPQVIIFDSHYSVTLPKLVYAVRSLLLLRLSGSGTATAKTDENDDEWQDKAMHFEQDMKDCLSRIQIAHSPQGDLTGWVPILETTRVQLAPTAADHPTLILWDGFLSEPDATKNEGARMEVIRQMERLLLDCSVLLITTTTAISAQESGSRSSTTRSHTTSTNGHNRREWERFITQRIRLDRRCSHTATAHNNSTGNNNHEYLASVHGAQIPFSISMAGILS